MRFCRLLGNSLRLSRVVKKGDERNGWHSLTSGIKQGCPLSRGLFFSLTEIAINKIMEASRETAASIDDLTCVVKNEEEVRVLLSKAPLDLAKIGLVLNWKKTGVHPFGYKVKFPMNVFTHCKLGEGWVYSVKREQGFRWIKCPPGNGEGKDGGKDGRLLSALRATSGQ